jgi:hypothetical protein
LRRASTEAPEADSVFVDADDIAHPLRLRAKHSVAQETANELRRIVGLDFEKDQTITGMA